MNSLNRKLYRDLWNMKGQAIAISLVIACGVTTYVMSLSTLESLRRTQQAYYERYRFAHVFASLKRAPNAVRDRIAQIPGVSSVQTRIVRQVTLNVPGLSEPAIGRLISMQPGGVGGLNGRYLRAGRDLEPGRAGEVLASEGFMKVHDFHPGSSIYAVINGRLQRLQIVGIALSPEYIYQIREGDILPDDRRYGVFWMEYTDLAAAFDMQGAFNDVCLTLEPGASQPEVIRQLDRLLEPYGGLGAYGREDQPSHKFLVNELEQLRGMAVIVPTIFLLVAGFLLHVVVTRLVATQREQIAILKAFGYSRLEVGWHYLKLIMMITLVGVILGTVVGARLGRDVTVMYTKFFRFPLLLFRLDPLVVVNGLFISCGVAILGTLGAVARAARLPPAEAMRPEVPAHYQLTFLERIGLQRFLSSPARMILRHLERQPVRTALSVLGIALAVAVLIMGNFMLDSINYVMESQFSFAQRQDVTLSLPEPTSSSVLSDIAHLPGVIAVEPMRGLSVRIRHEQRSRRLAVLGLPHDARLYRVMDIHRKLVPLPPGGLVLSTKLAEILNVGIGDTVRMEVLEGKRRKDPSGTTNRIFELPVTGLVADFSGLTAYMEIQAVNRLMEEGDVVTGANVAVDSQYLDTLYTTLKNTPRVASVTVKSSTVKSFRETVAENLLVMRSFNVMFASIIAFGVVYNSARIALAERSRELATLRVLGYTQGEISLILLGELGLITLTAIPVGMVFGYGLAYTVIHMAHDTELFRVPLIIGRGTYGFAATVTVIAAFISGLVVMRMLKQLDLIGVLKSKE